jgi:hypothetical protein
MRVVHLADRITAGGHAIAVIAIASKHIDFKQQIADLTGKDS